MLEAELQIILHLRRLPRWARLLFIFLKTQSVFSLSTFEVLKPDNKMRILKKVKTDDPPTKMESHEKNRVILGLGFGLTRPGF